MASAKGVMAFDPGEKYIGVAVGQTVTGYANPLSSLKAKDWQPDWAQIKALLEEWRPDQIVVGKPLNMDGSESETSQRAKKFANRLHGRFGLPVDLWDERLSSFEARGEILESRGGREFRSQNVDSISARLILESWMRSQSDAQAAQ